MNKEKKYSTITILQWVFKIFAFLFILYLFGGEIFSQFMVDDKLECTTFVSEWYQMDENGIWSQVKIPGSVPAKRGDTVAISTVLPETIENNKYLCFHCNHQDVKIFVDGELRQEYSTKEHRLFGKDSATYYLFFKFEEGDAGKVMTIETTTWSSYTGIYQEMYYGDRMGIWLYFAKLYVSEILVAIVMMILAVLAIVGSLFIRLKYRREVELEYLGYSVLIASIWIIANSNLRQLLFSNITVISNMAFFMVMLLPMPFLLYMNAIQKNRHHKIYSVGCTISVINIVVCCFLQFTNLVEFTDTIVVMAIICVVMMLLMGATMVRDIFSGTIKQYRLSAIGLLGSFLTAVLQFVLYFQKTVSFNGSIISLGLIFLLIIATINSVREVMRMEREKQKALNASESKARFLANMSHEIRTPINAILGMDTMILKESTEPAIREYAADIQNSGQSLLALINDILDFSKIESGKLEIVSAEYELTSLLVDSYNMISHRAKEKGLTLDIKVNETIPRRFLGDELRIRQILVNLLTNAVKYTRHGSVTLVVSGERREDGRFDLEFGVIDTGVGIAKENLDKLFTSFQRIDEANHRNIEGTGLGLSITNLLLNLMDGKISVESELGKGSTFRVIIPQNIAMDEPVGKFSLSKSYMNREIVMEEQKFVAPDASVLVVDDVSMNLKVFCSLLKDTRINVDTALSGQETLDKVTKKAYDIIFLDHMMPEMDGVETYYAMKQLENSKNMDTPVIMLTANAIQGAKNEYLNKGFSDYLSKPIQLSKLLKLIQKYLKEEKIVLLNDEEPKKQNEARSFEERFSFLDISLGLQYCLDEEIYREAIEEYAGDDKTEELEEHFAKKDWKNYQIITHAIKSSSLTLGAKELSEEAKQLEFAVKDNHISYIEQHHAEFMKHYQMMLQQMKDAMNS